MTITDELEFNKVKMFCSSKVFLKGHPQSRNIFKTYVCHMSGAILSVWAGKGHTLGVGSKTKALAFYKRHYINGHWEYDCELRRECKISQWKQSVHKQQNNYNQKATSIDCYPSVENKCSCPASGSVNW